MPRPSYRTVRERLSQLLLEFDGRRPGVASRRPEVHCRGVVVPHDEVHLRTPTFAQAVFDHPHQSPTDPVSTLICPHSDVIQPTAPAVPPTERRGGEAAIV